MKNVKVDKRIKEVATMRWVVGLGDGAGELPVPERPATFAYTGDSL